MKRFRRPMALFLAAVCLASPAALHTGCMGGTTGVDNPGLAELPVDFRDEAGGPARVSGTLEIYGREHNPAVDSEPLLRIGIAGQTGRRLTRADFERIDSALAPKAAANWKRSAAGAAGAAGSSGLADSGADSLIRFNLVFRDGSGSGAVATGLSYDPIRKVFGMDEAAGTGVRMRPGPLIRFAARLHREAGSADPGRVFLPGTPFQATLVDSDFTLQNLPEGRFGMRVLGGDGYMYAVRETLDTRAGHAFTAAPDPIGRIDATIAPAGFGANAGGMQNASALESTVLQGKLLGADPNDSRISFLWRLLRSQSTDTAHIEDPTRLGTRIVFPATGNYSVELSATLGATTVRDTAQYKVAPAPGPAQAKFITPQPGDTLQEGVTYKVTWDSPVAGLARLEYNYKDGVATSWVVAADSIKVSAGTTPALWAAPKIGIASSCLLRVRMIPSDSLLVQTPAPFYLVP